MSDSDPDVRWMTYGEAAKALRTNPESVAKRVRRNGWARRLGNDRKPRVAIPASVLADVPVSVPDVPDNAERSEPSVPDMIPDMIPDENPDAERAARAEGEAATLREERDRLLRERDVERARVDAVQAEATRERDRAEGALIRAAAAEAEAKALRETLTEARRPFWRRWLG